MADQETLTASTRDQVVAFGDKTKFMLGLGMHLQTPAICYACQHSGAIPNTCGEDQDMMGEVKNKFEWHSEYNEPLINICAKFLSNEMIAREPNPDDRDQSQILS